METNYIDISSQCTVSGTIITVSNITSIKVLYKKIGNMYNLLASINCTVSGTGFINISLPKSLIDNIILPQINAIAGGHAGGAASGYYQNGKIILSTSNSGSGNYYASIFI